MHTCIQANWPAPKNIKAYTTTRQQGASRAPFDQFNLGDHVGEAPTDTATNRKLLNTKLLLPSEPIWLHQTHSTHVIEANTNNLKQEADASYTHQPNIVATVLTADCLPILLCNTQGTHVAAIHAGWRGLVNGIIESTLDALRLPSQDILIWLGPAISNKHFEVGEEVREQFIMTHPDAKQAFTPSPNNRWLADLYQLANLRLQKQGITQIYGGTHCTYSEKELFYSYRRDGAKTGRMASLIWIEKNTHTE